jgi:hypothetical protein
MPISGGFVVSRAQGHAGGTKLIKRAASRPPGVWRILRLPDTKWEKTTRGPITEQDLATSFGSCDEYAARSRRGMRLQLAADQLWAEALVEGNRVPAPPKPREWKRRGGPMLDRRGSAPHSRSWRMPIIGTTSTRCSRIWSRLRGCRVQAARDQSESGQAFEW